MCYKGKCMCLEVETGLLIYAIINVMCSALLLMLSIGALVYINVFVKVAADEVTNYEFGYDRTTTVMGLSIAGVAGNVAFSVLIVIFGVAFGFAMCLIVGICKRNPHHVKAYFIYGMINACLSVVVFIITLCVSLYPVAIMLLIANVVFSLILYMIRMTYMKFQADVAFQSLSNPLCVIEKY